MYLIFKWMIFCKIPIHVYNIYRLDFRPLFNQMNFVRGLLADTKFPKDVLQQIIVGNMPRNLP